MTEKQKMSGYETIFTLFIGLSAFLATLILIFVYSKQVSISVLQSTWVNLLYFTILTNLFAAYFLIYSASKRRWLSFSWLTALTMWLTIVGSVYHTLLSPYHNPKGILGVTNQVHHTLVPIGVLLLWLFTRARESVSFKAPLKWMFFPLIYGAYSILRGIIEGAFPYFYSDPNIIGWKNVILSQIGFACLFLILGLLFAYIANQITRRRSPSTQVSLRNP